MTKLGFERIGPFAVVTVRYQDGAYLTRTTQWFLYKGNLFLSGHSKEELNGGNAIYHSGGLNLVEPLPNGATLKSHEQSEGGGGFPTSSSEEWMITFEKEKVTVVAIESHRHDGRHPTAGYRVSFHRGRNFASIEGAKRSPKLQFHTNDIEE